MEDIGKTPANFPKIVFGYACVTNYTSFRNLRDKLKSSSLGKFLGPPEEPGPGLPAPPDTYRVIPPFTDAPPDLSALSTNLAYREPPAVAGTTGHILVGPDFMPTWGSPDPTNPTIHPPGRDATVAPFRLTLNDVVSLTRVITSHYAAKERIAEKFQREFDQFLEILVDYVSPDAYRQLENEIVARDPRRVIAAIIDRIRRANDPQLTAAVETQAHALDWGLNEDLTHFFRRKEDIWQHLLELNAPISEDRKKDYIIRMITHATGSNGPYSFAIGAFKLNRAGTSYEALKEALLNLETDTVAIGGRGNKTVGDERHVYLPSWLPYDAKKVRGEWVYDEKKKAAYLDPKAYYNTVAVVRGSAMVAESTATTGKPTAAGGGAGGGAGGKGRTFNCPFCPGEKHRFADCPNAVRCKNDCCKGWRHRKGQPCDGGAARREWENKQKARGQPKGRGAKAAPKAAAHVATTETGTLPKAPEAAPTPASQPPTSADIANLIRQQAMLTEQFQRWTDRARRSRSASRAAVIPATPHTVMFDDDDYSDFKDYSS